MIFIIVPNDLEEQLRELIDEKTKNYPITENEKEELYKQLLYHCYIQGVVPDFDIVYREEISLAE